MSPERRETFSRQLLARRVQQGVRSHGRRSSAGETFRSRSRVPLIAALPPDTFARQAVKDAPGTRGRSRRAFFTVVGRGVTATTCILAIYKGSLSRLSLVRLFARRGCVGTALVIIPLPSGRFSRHGGVPSPPTVAHRRVCMYVCVNST